MKHNALTRPASTSIRPQSWDGAHGGRAALTSLRRDLAIGLARQVTVGGVVDGNCRSRVLESMLLLSLLRKANAHPEVQNELLRHVQSSQPHTTFDLAMIEAARDPDSDRPRELTVSLLKGFNHYTGDRKRMMLVVCLYLVGLAPASQLPAPSHITYHGFATWTNLTQCAAKILSAFAREEPDQARPEDCDYLLHQLRTGSCRKVWEGNALAHLIALHAAYALDGTVTRLIEDGITTLIRLRGRDGGIPFIESQDIYLTATAGMALAGSGMHELPTFLMADYLASKQSSDGGWGYAAQVIQTDVDDTSWCVDFLRTVMPDRYRCTINAGEDFLTASAGDDGGFPTYLRGHSSEPAMTAGAVIALTPVFAQHSKQIDAATDFLLHSQNADGTFELSWTLSRSSVITRVLDALHGVRSSLRPATQQRIDAATTLAMKHLHDTQNTDGGWGHHEGEPSDVLSTAQALPSIRRSGQPQSRRRAISYLLSDQTRLAGLTSPPDQVGPRPFPYDFPILTNILLLQGINRLFINKPANRITGGTPL